MAITPEQILHWTFPVPRLGLVPVRAHWTVLLLMVFDLAGLANGYGLSTGGEPWPLWLLPAALPIFWLAYWAHEIFHRFVARWLGITQHSTAIHMVLGGWADLTMRVKAWPMAAYAGSGLLGSLLVGVAGSCSVLLLPDDPQWSILSQCSRYFAYVGFLQLGINLFAVYPFDLGLLERAILWPILGLRRAVTVTLATGYVQIAITLIFAAWFQNLTILFLGVSLLFAIAREHRSILDGHDPWLGGNPDYLGSNRAIWTRWSERRAESRAERTAQIEEDEDALLDRLLDKVSSQGLPALSAKERKQLERISRKRKDAG